MAGSKYITQNRRVIHTAFTRLGRDADAIILDGMTRVAQAGLEYLLGAHDDHSPWMNHPIENDTLASVVAHNGEVVASFPHDGGEGDLPGNASDEAKRILRGTSGWVAIIHSDMKGWYRVDYELAFLAISADEVKANFNRFFKPIAK